MKTCDACHRLYADDGGFCPIDGQKLTPVAEATVPTDANDKRMGTTLCEGRYQIWRTVADGGMGRVYQAIDNKENRSVALKILHSDVATDSVAVARFKREFECSAALPHDYIVEVLAFEKTEDGSFALVMEYLEGEELRMLLKREKVLSPERLVRMLSQTAIGLSAAHDRKVVHRDLKPDNIFLLDRDDDELFAKILDFGISKIARRGDGRSTTITQEGTVLGTPVYMSPEQAQALPDVDGRADLWSVGAILYECLSGRPPHSGGTYEQVIVNICMKDVDDIRLHNPIVPAGVASVIAKALTRERADRFQTARGFLDALVVESGGVLSGRSSSSSDARKARTPTPSVPVVEGPLTLGAVSTIAALPSSLPPAAARTSARSRPGVYMGVAIGAVILGVVVAVTVTISRKDATAEGPQGVVFAAIGPGKTTSASSTSPASAEIPPDLPATTSATSSAAPSAAASPSARRASSASSANVDVGARPHAPLPTAKGGLGSELQLQTH